MLQHLKAVFHMVPTGPGNREFDMGASRAGKSPDFHSYLLNSADVKFKPSTSKNGGCSKKLFFNVCRK